MSASAASPVARLHLRSVRHPRLTFNPAVLNSSHCFSCASVGLAVGPPRSGSTEEEKDRAHRRTPTAVLVTARGCDVSIARDSVCAACMCVLLPVAITARVRWCILDARDRLGSSVRARGSGREPSLTRRTLARGTPMHHHRTPQSTEAHSTRCTVQCACTHSLTRILAVDDAPRVRRRRLPLISLLRSLVCTAVCYRLALIRSHHFSTDCA
jgi:hypothetical protein